MEESQKIADIGGYKKPVMSIGDEFMAWAEQYWGIDKKYAPTAEDIANNEQEDVRYDAVRSIFVEHINEIVNQRIRHYF